MSFLVGEGEHIVNDYQSFTYVVASGESDLIRVGGSQVVYKVLRGEGTFYIAEGDEEREGPKEGPLGGQPPSKGRAADVTEGSVVVVSKGAVFSSAGDLIMKAIFIPPFNGEVDVIKSREACPTKV